MAVAMGADDLKSRTQVLKYSVQSQRVKESKSQPLPAPPQKKKCKYTLTISLAQVANSRARAILLPGTFCRKCFFTNVHMGLTRSSVKFVVNLNEMAPSVRVDLF